MRRHLCIDGRCNCPSGETATNQGCVPTQVLMEQNASLTCLPGQYSNGVACVTAVAECAGVNGQAANYVAQLRGLRSQMDQACAQNSSSQDCEDAQANFRQTMLLYRSLWDGARSECRATLADPASF
ncbi:MAG TPA: hypothetical protein VMH04_02410 [Candidatus Solibacter sp.]|nr:hypothetical protein [Candidatus Solibacter sp.]